MSCRVDPALLGVCHAVQGRHGSMGAAPLRPGRAKCAIEVSSEFRSTSSLLVGQLLPLLALRATLCLGALVFAAAAFHVQILATKQAFIGK